MASNFYRKTTTGIGTAVTQVGATAGAVSGGYTVAAATQTTIIGMTIANVTSGSVTATVELYNGATAVTVVKNAPIPAGSSIVVVGGDQKIVLQTGDSMRVTGNTAASLDVIMSVLEIA